MAEIEFIDRSNNLAISEIEFSDGLNNSAMAKIDNFDTDTASYRAGTLIGPRI